MSETIRGTSHSFAAGPRYLHNFDERCPAAGPENSRSRVSHPLQGNRGPTAVRPGRCPLAAFVSAGPKSALHRAILDTTLETTLLLLKSLILRALHHTEPPAIHFCARHTLHREGRRPGARKFCSVTLAPSTAQANPAA